VNTWQLNCLKQLIDFLFTKLYYSAPNILANLYNKRACPTKNEPQQGISYLEREREGWGGVRERGVSGNEREKGGRVSRSADRLI
jgi:hypothetical protein